MSATAAVPDVPAPSTGLVGQPVNSRIVSLDIFRGFTMAVMIFVNDVGDVSGLSRWTYHIPRNIDAMSYVDMVYPFFLFAVGLSLPLAIRQRLRRDPSLVRLWLHILLRCGALLVLGLILANAEHVNRSLVHLRGSAWATLALLGAILLWAVYPRTEAGTTARRLTNVLRTVGALLLLGMLAIFRRATPDGRAAWLNFAYPEILGLIGLTYLAVCLLYVPTRRLPGAPLAGFVLLVLFNIATSAHWLTVPRPMYLFPFDNGAMSAITMAGVLVSGLFFHESLREHPHRQIALALGFAASCGLAGLVLRPLGISKIRATPTWALWSVAAATTTFALFYFVGDIHRRTGWAFLLRAPGANTLLTYLLPDLTYYTLAFTGLGRRLPTRWNAGLPGVARSVCFTVGTLLLSRVLTRARVRLQL